MAGISYYEAFQKVTNKRLSYAVNIFSFLSLLVIYYLSFPYETFQSGSIAIFYRVPLVLIACQLVKNLREKTSTTKYSVQKTLADQIVHSVISGEFITGTLLYMASALIVGGMHIFQLPFAYSYYVLSKEYQQRPLINDSWVFYWFSLVYTAIVYSLQFYIFQRNMLKYKIGVLKVNPQEVLFRKIPLFIGLSLVLTISVGFTAPILYILLHSLVYKTIYLPALILGLDTGTPSYSVSFEVWSSVVYMCFGLILLWELVNHPYEVYVTIGCLDISKPISTYCEDPISSLVVALQDIRPESQLCRLTAFQELAYIATTTEPDGIKLRASVYESHKNNTSSWQAIYEECSLLIREAASRISYRSPSDLEPPIQLGVDGLVNNPTSPVDIFGNSTTAHVVSHQDPIPVLAKNDNPDSKTTKTTNAGPYSYALSTIQLQVLTPLLSLLSMLQISKTVKDKEKTFGKVLISKIDIAKKQYYHYRQEFLSTPYGKPFRVSLHRDAESRVINPVDLGNAAIALANLLIHAIEQDKTSTITNTQISDVMNLLELPISACSEYSRSIPRSVYVAPGQEINRHVIAKLHDVFMSEYFQICIKYNHKLNDLMLTSGSFKLAKLVVDVAIAENQQSKAT
ncbi:Nucleoporin NDC1 [Meyerozyma sp. JA9]|nr:Nucleoporin NDC1 [Meyerozyma sp. JA9]